jgi:microcystin-dependent protein
MANPYLGEIRMVGFNFAPTGWAQCSGQLLSISQNTALFSILGTTYGGDGKSTFGLPNLQASTPMSFGNGSGLTQRTLGEPGGEYAVTLLQTQMPAHNHGVACLSGGGTSDSPANAFWANDGLGRGINIYATWVFTSSSRCRESIQRGTSGAGKRHPGLRAECLGIRNLLFRTGSAANLPVVMYV